MVIKTSNLELDFANFAGDVAKSFSFNRALGQIYGLLYLNPAPLSLDDIAKNLSMSKGNASINLRTLESWGAVRPISVHGSRRDHYQANRNLKEIVIKRVKEGLEKRLSMAKETIDHLFEKPETANSLDPDVRKQVESVRSMISKAEKALTLLPKLVNFLP